MASPGKIKQADSVADKVLKRAEIGKMTRRLQNRLALAQFKTDHGWEDLSLDAIQPRVEAEKCQKKLLQQQPPRLFSFDNPSRPLTDVDGLSDSSSSATELPTCSQDMMNSPLKASLFAPTVLGSGSSRSSSSNGHRKRTYVACSRHDAHSSPDKRLCMSPTPRRRPFAAAAADQSPWRTTQHHHHHFAHSSPLKPRRQQHFTTSIGPDLSFLSTARIPESLTSPTTPTHPPLSLHHHCSSDDDHLLPFHSFQATSFRASSPRTPPPTRSRRRTGRDGGAATGGNSGEQGADLLLYLASSPVAPPPPPQPPVVEPSCRLTLSESSSGAATAALTSTTSRMGPPSTPPPRFAIPNSASSNKQQHILPPSMMATPGGGTVFPATPGLDFSDFVHMTPSPAPKAWKTPMAGSTGRTPQVEMAKRRLTYDDLS